MDKDPFSELIGLFREEGSFYNEPSFFVGVVKSGLPNIEVATNGVILDKTNLKIDKWLLDRSKEMATQSAGDPTHTHKIDSPIKDVLKSGDEVVLLRSSNNIFIIISKVVSL